MIDLKALRDDDGTMRAALARRGVEPATLDRVLGVDERRRALITEASDLRARQRQLGKEIGSAGGEQERRALIDETRQVGERLRAIEPEEADAEAELQALLEVIPNVPHPDAPNGEDEDDAVQLSMFGELPSFEFEPLDHVSIGERWGLLDIERGVKVSGSRFAFLLGDAVLLEFALVRHVMDTLVRHGFTPAIPPVLTRRDALYGTAFLPTGAEQIYEIPADELYLVGTSEVPLAGMHADEILEPEQLPLRYAGFSTCFRREAGTYGKDTQGIFRVHQFDKVEMFSYVLPEDSEDEHARMRDIEVDIFSGLGLHGRVVDIPVGDLGASASRKYDVEVWLPGQQRYRELTSTSNTLDYQARRQRTRYRTQDGGTELVHMLNGTGVAVPRAIIALLEHHQRADGTVAVPEPLVGWLGKEVIGG